MSDTTATTAITTNRTAAATSPAAAEMIDEDVFLSNSELLARDEVLKRRSRRLKRLARVYRDRYWCMMEEVKLKYRKYYWEFGKSPYQQENETVNNNNSNNNNNNNNGDEEGELGLKEVSRCAVHGCKTKAMALTKFCHAHILSDSKQKLYIGCNYVIKSSQAGPIICGKPILKCMVPSLCASHFQKAEKHVARALKKAGLNVSSTNKLAPKFHVMVAEYVRQIQSNRRVIEKEIKENLEIKEEDISI